MSIDNIQINIICEQYIQYIEEAQSLDMELASEFIVMASELMLIKSKLLLPKPEAEEEDPRAALADALQKYQQAKEGAKKMALLYQKFSGRLEKDTDEISIDKSFVLDHEIEALCLAVRRIITYNENRPKIEREVFTPMISAPIVPVEVKITGILRRMSAKPKTSLKELLSDSVSLPDMIAIFLGVLELIKIRKILIYDSEGALLDMNAEFTVNQNQDDSKNDETFVSDFDEISKKGDQQ
jgi:segregation and condensation protein A